MADSTLPNSTPADMAPAAKPAPSPTAPKAQEEPKDAVREIVETVVFVVVLVLLLKTFVAEAFVIPTGSMAETLYGYQKLVDCPQCGYRFPVNSSGEVDPQEGNFREVIACRCPNCNYHEEWKRHAFDGLTTVKKGPSSSSGDRVLVAKFFYDDSHLSQPERHDVVVFKYPENPQKNQVAMNYIKRLEGLPGETVAIFEGNLYVTNNLDYPAFDHARPENPLELWRPEYMYRGDDRALELFEASRKRAAENRPQTGDFTIIRKPPLKMMALRRIVHDNDHQAKDLVPLEMPRWHADGNESWTADNREMPRVFTSAKGNDDVRWLRYRHYVVNRDKPKPTGPTLITNTMGYNSGEPGNPGADHKWVGDLMLEATVRPDSASGELLFELSKGPDRFRAVFDLAKGECILQRIGARGEVELGRAPAVLKAGEERLVRFANFDDRLTVWLGGSLLAGDTLPFGDGVNYPPSLATGPVDANDVERPASIGSKHAAMKVSNLKLWRDSYYTDHERRGPIQTFYVQPGHFLCLGDNSAESSDSRFWGLVPERLMLGRALVVYYPFRRIGLIR